MGVLDWSQTAADNDDADATINFLEGQAPSTVNNSARALMAAVAKLVADQGGAVTTGGSSNAYTFNSASDVDAYADGMMLYMVANHTNTGAATLNVESLGAKKLRKVTTAGEVALDANDLMQNGHYLVGYDASADSAAGAFIVHGPSTVTVADGAITAAKIATDAVGSDEIAAGAVGTSEIATDGVGSAEIAADAVEASEIAAGAVGTSEIATDGVGADEIATGAVGTAEIADGTVAYGDLASAALATTSDIWAGTGNKLISVGVYKDSLAEVALTFNASLTPNGANGINFVTTGVSSNFTLNNMSGEVIGYTYCIRLVHSASSNVASYGTDYEGINGTLPVVSTTSGNQDRLYIQYFAANRALVWLARDIS